jgi:hypothetical protein
MVDWLIDYLLFLWIYWIFHLYGDVPLPVKGCKFRPMLGAQGLWAGRDLYRATPAVTRDPGLSGLIRRTAPFSRLLRHTRGCGGSILTRILTGHNTNGELSNTNGKDQILQRMTCIHFVSLDWLHPLVKWTFSVLYYELIKTTMLVGRVHLGQWGGV